MSLRRLRHCGVAFWLGLVALSLNALVPIHIAFDIADALKPNRAEHAGFHDHHHGGRHLLAELVGHRHAGGGSGGHSDHRHLDCPVCGSLGTLAGFAAAPGAALSTPFLVEAPPELAAASGVLIGAAPAAYQSRAPPVTG